MSSKVIVSFAMLALLAPATAFARAPSGDGSVQLVDDPNDGLGLETPFGTLTLQQNGQNAPPAPYAGAQQTQTRLRIVPPSNGSVFVYDGTSVVARVDRPETIALPLRGQYGIVGTRGDSTLWSGFVPGASQQVDVSFAQGDTPTVSTQGPVAAPNQGYVAPPAPQPGQGYYGPGYGYPGGYYTPSYPGYYNPGQSGTFVPNR